jgi:serine/threonine-protein kinase
MRPQRIGRYVIHERLGRGGTGLVSKAWDESEEQWVAIKSVLPEHTTRARQESLYAEARVAAELDHPAIARVHGVVTEGDRTHIVMELVEGRLLSELLKESVLGVELAISLARQLAEGLSVAHRHGLVHGDLKAENVMVVDGCHAKILDFGLAAGVIHRDANEGPGNQAVVGTARAMSPEQAAGRSIDHRSDLFSLGTLLYHMVTGVHPFAAGDPFETMHSVAFQEPPPLHHLNPDAPEPLTELVGSLLEKNPKDRPESAMDVAARLEALQISGSSGVPNTPSG